MTSRVVVITAALLALATLPAAAQTKRSGPCGPDIEKYCSGVAPGGGRFRDCLQQHENDLSQACKDHLRSAQGHTRQRRAAVDAACKADVEKFCKEVQQGQGRVVQCLRSHESELSDACKTAVAKGRQPAAP